MSKKQSFTDFPNKIGLFVNESNDVVLSFPYKDCVLEAGMTKEDNKTEEYFLNNNMKQDEIHIDTLFAPKALTNFQKIAGGGYTNIVSPDEIEFWDEDGNLKQNLMIKWNNLVALHSLEKKLTGKVKLIYIDPPYNTGNDGFSYNDKFSHSTWLVFMQNRLEVAKELLADDGVIFVQCDDNEQAYLKVLMDEIFGRENFVSTIHCQMSTTQWMKVKAAQNGNIVKNAEYILVFSKDWHKDVAIQPLYDLRQEYDEHYTLYLKSDGTIGQLKDLYDFRFPKDLNNKKPLSLKEAFRKSEDFYEIVRTHLAEIVRTDKVTWFDLSTELENGKWKEVERNWKKYVLTLDLKWNVKQLLRLKDSWWKTDNYRWDEWLRKIRWNWWEGFYIDMGNVSKEWGVDFANGKKNERLISQIIKMSTNPWDLVLDYHLGSGTTAAVAHKMGRRWIGIEQMDYIDTIAKERLKKVIDGEQGGISKSVNWQGGGDFVYMELKTFNADFVEAISHATSKDALNKIYHDMKRSAFLKFFFDPEEFENEESEQGKIYKELPLAEQKEKLLKVLDMNHIYLNAGDYDKTIHTISELDKSLTAKFYGNN